LQRALQLLQVSAAPRALPPVPPTNTNTTMLLLMMMTTKNITTRMCPQITQFALRALRNVIGL